ncbi:tripartite tricarboxylate transporter TctB family protein [Roseibium suaedae]|uniref:Tripartite tricarboxylate transporter TctB family protein n=1 Tax=Roseibium suaedae TaxID=735517 RepID=A0A1M7PHP4_9HYPH|nr:tripartite tricarboxylate transporter TctB family protein [Roseibium suaedae]SHN16566.1 Tripartite tricarboxylate transporter TctB family protein [Roseibium suaedae]
MVEPRASRLLRPETLTALGIIAVAAAFLIPALELRANSALLPVAMLIGLIVLATVLLISDQRKAAAGHVSKPMTKAPGRVAGAFLLVIAYVVATSLIGFYPATIITVPLVAHVFGYRSFFGLAAATLIVVGAIYLVFDYAMAQQFPTGLLLGR